jgi:hypothetical protein
MALPSGVRPGVVAFAAIGLALLGATTLLDARPTGRAYAQAEVTATVLASQTLVPEVSAAGTPAAPAAPESAAGTAPPAASGNSMTASLGGSDIAVSSVGGSYEIDGPKRKAKKVLKLTPTP